MRYYLDCEFNGFEGDLISLALVREDGPYMYIADQQFLQYVQWSDRSAICSPGIDKWVWENVLPLLGSKGGRTPTWIERSEFAGYLQSFLRDDSNPVIIADWPDDVKYFCQCLIVGPGMMINIPAITFEVHRVDAYPTAVPGLIQHQALDDAMALLAKLQGDA